MIEERQKFASGVHLLLMRNEQILLLRRYQTGYEDGNYTVPAGHLDGKETTRAAAVREAKEEVGVTIDPADLTLLQVMHRNKPGIEEKIEFFFHVHRWQGDPINAEPHKCNDVSWFPVSELPQNFVPYIKFALEQIARGERYTEYGWPEEGV